jgi:hypothetical protein
VFRSDEDIEKGGLEAYGSKHSTNDNSRNIASCRRRVQTMLEIEMMDVFRVMTNWKYVPLR